MPRDGTRRRGSSPIAEEGDPTGAFETRRRTMESSREISGVGAEGTESLEEPVCKLPPIQLPKRPHCRSCQRNDRPIFGSVCGWCSDRE